MNGTWEVFENLTNELLSIDMENAALDTELNTLLFGRILNKPGPELSVFERVLKTSGNSRLINLIWNKLGLATHREILDLVSLS